MKKRTYYCGRCFHFLIDPNILDREVGRCSGQKQRTVSAKQKACKNYRHKPLNP